MEENDYKLTAKDIEEVLKLIEHMLKWEKIENKKYTPKKYRK